MCRSEPQTPDASTRTTASSAAIGSGSGRSSMATRPGSWKVTASMAGLAYASATQQGRRPVAGVVQLVEEPVDHREHVVEAQQPAPGHGPARVVEPKRHAGVHVLGRAHALADRERSLVHQLADDPAEHEPRRVLHPLAHEAALLEEGDG